MEVITHCHHCNNYSFLKFLLTHFLSCNLKMDPNDKMDSNVNILIELYSRQGEKIQQVSA